MNFYKKLRRKPKQFLTFTGMSLERFEELLPEFEAADRAVEAERKRVVVRTGAARKRKPGGGGKYQNDLANRLLMTLLYLRLYCSQEFISLLFRSSDGSVVSRTIKATLPVLERVLPVPERERKRILSLAKEVNKQRKRRIGTIEEFLEAYPELDFILDVVEQGKRKPRKKEKRKSDYSGKKCKHTNKQAVMTTSSGLIVHQSRSIGGRPHDFALFKQDLAENKQLYYNELGIENGIRATLYGDSGFQGLEDLGLPCEARLIQRAKRNHPLTLEEKKINKLRAGKRIKIEHSFAQRKKYRIASDIYRNDDQYYDQYMNVVSGLVNLRIKEHIYQKTGIYA